MTISTNGEKEEEYILLHTQDTLCIENNKDIVYVANSIGEAIKKHECLGTRIIIPDGYQDSELHKLVEFEDYIYQRYYAKPLVIIYGNCHTTAISDYLEKCHEFCKKFALFRIRPIHTIRSAEYFENPVFRHCDYFVHQSIQIKNRYGEEYASENVIKHLKHSCKIISIPNVYGLPKCFFPQYTKEFEFKQRKGTTVFFRDCIIDSAAEKGEIISEKEYNEYQFDALLLDKALDDFFAKVEEREKDWDIKCLKYIKENYKTNRLFYDPNHPTNNLISYITGELLAVLGIKEINLQNVSVKALTGYEMPIVNSVKNHYGLSFGEDEEMREGSYNKVKLGKMTGTSDYIKQYFSCEWQNRRTKKRIAILSFSLFLYFKIYNIFYRLLSHTKSMHIGK